MRSLIDLSRLSPEIDEFCEAVFQKKMRDSDGKLCIIDATEINGIGLLSLTLEAQIMLNCLARTSCPISNLRFGASLYPFRFPSAPILSYELSQIYIFDAIETIVNLHYDSIAMQAIDSFQSSSEFHAIIQIANELVERLAISSLVCPEVYDYIKQHNSFPNFLSIDSKQ